MEPLGHGAILHRGALLVRESLGLLALLRAHGNLVVSERACASRQTMSASPPGTRPPSALHHTGMTKPATTTSQPAKRRIRCTIAMNARKTTVTVVKGFMESLLF